MYDLHAHILPGVDDGPQSSDETLEMFRIAADSGTQAMLATPHRKDVTENWSVAYIESLLEEAAHRNTREGIQLELLLGMENHLDPSLAEEIIAGRALPMNGTLYILVEMPFFGRPVWIETALEEVQSLGFTPVLAHPERIEAFQRDVDLLGEFIERGMLSQITVGSLLGYFGSEVQIFTEELLRRGMVHVLASDTHSAGGPRRPVLAPGIDAASRIVGQESARKLVTDTPDAILRGVPIEVP